MTQPVLVTAGTGGIGLAMRRRGVEGLLPRSTLLWMVEAHVQK